MSIIHVKLNGKEDGFCVNNCDELMNRIADAFGTLRQQLIIRDKEGHAVHGATEPWPPTEKPWELVVEKDEEIFVDQVRVHINGKDVRLNATSAAELYEQIDAMFECRSDLLEYYDLFGNKVSLAVLPWPLGIRPLCLQVIDKSIGKLFHNYNNTGIVGYELNLCRLLNDEDLQKRLEPYMDEDILASNYLSGGGKIWEDYRKFHPSGLSVKYHLQLEGVTGYSSVIIPAYYLTV